MRFVNVRRGTGRLGENQLVRATVLSETRDKLRVKLPGVFHPVEINAADALPCSQSRKPDFGFTRPQQVYNFPGSLARMLNP